MFKIMKDGVSHRKNADSLILGHRRTNFQSNGRLAVGSIKLCPCRKEATARGIFNLSSFTPDGAAKLAVSMLCGGQQFYLSKIRYITENSRIRCPCLY